VANGVVMPRDCWNPSIPGSYHALPDHTGVWPQQGMHVAFACSILFMEMLLCSCMTGKSPVASSPARQLQPSVPGSGRSISH